MSKRPHGKDQQNKSKLSFLLNNDDSDGEPDPSRGYNAGRGGSSGTGFYPRYPQQGGASSSASASKARSSHQASSSASAGRGVRKQRQRKFACDTCGFAFYTNSDLQKVWSRNRLAASFFDCTPSSWYHMRLFMCSMRSRDWASIYSIFGAC